MGTKSVLIAVYVLLFIANIINFLNYLVNRHLYSGNERTNLPYQLPATTNWILIILGIVWSYTPQSSTFFAIYDSLDLLIYLTWVSTIPISYLYIIRFFDSLLQNPQKMQRVLWWAFGFSCILIIVFVGNFLTGKIDSVFNRPSPRVLFFFYQRVAIFSTYIICALFFRKADSLVVFGLKLTSFLYIIYVLIVIAFSFSYDDFFVGKELIILENFRLHTFMYSIFSAGLAYSIVKYELKTLIPNILKYIYLFSYALAFFVPIIYNATKYMVNKNILNISTLVVSVIITIFTVVTQEVLRKYILKSKEEHEQEQKIRYVQLRKELNQELEIALLLGNFKKAAEVRHEISKLGTSN